MIADLARAPYRGPSEAQAAALAAAPKNESEDARRRREHPFEAETTETVNARLWRRQPSNIDAWMLWFAEQWRAETPSGLHTHDVWADHPKPFVLRKLEEDDALGGRKGDMVPMRNEAAGVGGSLIGSPAETAPFVSIVSGHHHQRDNEGDLVTPFRSSLAHLRGEAQRVHDALVAVARSGFAWRAIIDRPFYEVHRTVAHDGTETTRRVLVMAMPEDVLEAVLTNGCHRLWNLLEERLPRIRAIE